ncbi:YmaF family protein [Clostridium sp. FP2]|uniref:YmaF family protein n=1 Tax=Clostridium sp. FP2 TaxID=2724481 RepID=UPI0013E9208A|nr:YmaF family protein [Clostridium sp. FP2]MBZ9622587.1 YmaF family protein [Clostridium sp. FP2]
MSKCENKHDFKDCCEKEHDDNDCCKKERQFHDHEFEGSTRLAELEDDPHNHRFAGVSSPAIPVQGGHVHRVKGRTDFFDHFHEFEATSGRQIPVGEGKHVHFVEANTTVNDGHCHELIFATLIEAPIFEEEV